MYFGAFTNFFLGLYSNKKDFAAKTEKRLQITAYLCN
jgi:hypothetical protein